jgi:RNA polymerase sigma-70 factor (family 1)
MGSDNLKVSFLVERLHRGDEGAFGQLYKLFSPRIYGKLLKLTGSERVAGELLQDTFVKLWENRYKIESDGFVKSWLYRVAENEVYGFYRKAARDKKLQDHIAATFNEVYEHIEEDIVERERRELLERAIGRLSPQRREVFTLCRIEGKSYQEAAELLGISSSTVSNTLVKANSSVRQFLFRAKDGLLLLVAAYLVLSRLYM